MWGNCRRFLFLFFQKVRRKVKSTENHILSVLSVHPPLWRDMGTCAFCHFNTNINRIDLNANIFMGIIFWWEPCLSLSHLDHPPTVHTNNWQVRWKRSLISITMWRFAQKCFGPSTRVDVTLTHAVHLNIAADESRLRGRSCQDQLCGRRETQDSKTGLNSTSAVFAVQNRVWRAGRGQQHKLGKLRPINEG